MKKAFSYVRFSTKEQMKGASLKRQLETSQRYADEHGLILDTTLQDQGVSAFDGSNIQSNSALGGFLELVRNNKIDSSSWLLVENFDRLSRQKPILGLASFVSILELGITVVTLNDNRVYTSESINESTDQLFWSIMTMIRANEESATKSKRLKDAWDRKRDAARKDPVKNRISKKCPSWLKLDDETGTYTIIEERAAVIRDIFNMMDNVIGQRRIASILNKAKIPTFYKKKKVQLNKYWQDSVIHKVITGQQVLGHYQPQKREGSKKVNDGELIKNYYPAIITEEQYWRIKKARENRRMTLTGRKGKTYSSLFSRMIKCKECGTNYRYINKGTHHRSRFMICGARRNSACESQTK